jgi:hypothetical protein
LGRASDPLRALTLARASTWGPVADDSRRTRKSPEFHFCQSALKACQRKCPRLNRNAKIEKGRGFAVTV